MAEKHQFLSFPALFTFLIFLFMLLLRIWKQFRTSSSTPNLPPGPWKLPVIGSIHHLIGSQPHLRLRDLAQKYGPLMHLQLGEITTIVVSSPETATEILKHNDIIFAQRPVLLVPTIFFNNNTDVAFARYGDYWRQMRKISTLELLSSKRVQTFRSIRENEVSKLVRSINSKAGSPINFSRMINSLTYSIISTAAFGKIWKGEEIFLSNIKKFLQEMGRSHVADLYPSIKLLHLISPIRPMIESLLQKVDKILQNIIEEHRTRKAAMESLAEGVPEGFVDVLLKFQNREDLQFPLTDENIKSVILDMFGAGTETSSTTVIWAMSEMLKNPTVMKKAQAEVRQVFNKKGYVDEDSIGELKYLNSVIRETLRFHPPVPLLLPRECRKSCVINGYDIPIKSRIIVNARAIARDPNYWIEADRFYPERFLDCSVDYKGNDFEYIPFGAGRRICPGITFGMANVEFPLASLLYHFDWKLPNEMQPEDFDMTEIFGVVVARKTDLHIIPIPYFPPPLN